MNSFFLFFIFVFFRLSFLCLSLKMLRYVPEKEQPPETWDARAFLSTICGANCREQRMLVMRSTLRVFESGRYALPDGRVIVLPRDACTAARAALHAAVQRLVFAHLPDASGLPHAPTHHPVEVVCGDCVDAAARLISEGAAGAASAEAGSRVALLDMASRQHPGGGYMRGAGAQEENLCRRSNLWAHLDCNSGSGWGFGRRGKGRSPALYPIPARGALYARDVLFVRGNEPGEGYAFLAAPLRVDVVAVAACVRPPTTAAGDYAREEDRAATLDTVRAALHACAQNGAHDVVLSALGCGAFRHPPAAVARLFRRALSEYAPCFRRVVFAIYDDHNAPKSGNYAPFKRILHGFVPGTDPVDFDSGDGAVAGEKVMKE